MLLIQRHLLIQIFVYGLSYGSTALFIGAWLFSFSVKRPEYATLLNQFIAVSFVLFLTFLALALRSALKIRKLHRAWKTKLGKLVADNKAFVWPSGFDGSGPRLRQNVQAITDTIPVVLAPLFIYPTQADSVESGILRGPFPLVVSAIQSVVALGWGQLKLNNALIYRTDVGSHSPGLWIRVPFHTVSNMTSFVMVGFTLMQVGETVQISYHSLISYKYIKMGKTDSGYRHLSDTMEVTLLSTLWFSRVWELLPGFCVLSLPQIIASVWAELPFTTRFFRLPVGPECGEALDDWLIDYYRGQGALGIQLRVIDQQALNELRQVLTETTLKTVRSALGGR